MNETSDRPDISPTPPNTDTDRRGRERRAGVAMIVVAILLTAIVGWFIYDSRQGDTVQGGVRSYDLPQGETMSATIDIIRPADVAVTCDLVAVDDRQIIVGQKTLEVPAGPEEKLVVDTKIPLEGDGIVVKLRSCHEA